MRSLAALIASLALLSGCSRFAMERLPDDHRAGQVPFCTATRGWALIDGAIVTADAATIVTAAVVAGSDESDNDEQAALGVVALAALVQGVLHLQGAVHGYRAAVQCQEARRDFLGRHDLAPSSDGTNAESGTP